MSVNQAAVAAPPSKPLPYSFARRYGVFLEPGSATDVNTVLCHRPGLTPEVLAEITRLLPTDFLCRELDESTFDKALAHAYQRDSSETMQMVEDSVDEMDLASLADSVPETEDLLEKEDDAPIIRLINALLTEAIKQNASDIHIETFEKPPDRALPRRRRTARSRAAQARAGAAAGVADQGHGEARHRRKARAAGWPHFAAGRRPRCRYARLDAAVECTASASCCGCSTRRPGG